MIRVPIPRFLPRLARSIRVAYFEMQVHRFEAAATQARTAARNLFLHHSSTREDRLEAMHAWEAAGGLADHAESYRNKIRKVIYEAV